MISKKTHEIINTLFKSLLNRYHLSLEESMKDSNFAFDSLLLFLKNFCFDGIH